MLFQVITENGIPRVEESKFEFAGERQFFNTLADANSYCSALIEKQMTALATSIEKIINDDELPDTSKLSGNVDSTPLPITDLPSDSGQVEAEG